MNVPEKKEFRENRNICCKESLKTDEALFLETKEFFRDNLAKDKTLNNDFERAEKSNQKSNENDGFLLIKQKLIDALKKEGLTKR